MGLVGSLLRQAGRDPERIALADSVGRSVSYAHLALAVGIGAGRLRDAGIGPGDRVLLCLPNGFDFVRAYYSVIAAGAIAVPVSPQLPVGDVERVVDDCQPSAAIAAPDAAVFGPKVRLTCADLTCNEAENEDGARYAAPGRGALWECSKRLRKDGTRPSGYLTRQALPASRKGLCFPGKPSQRTRRPWGRFRPRARRTFTCALFRCTIHSGRLYR